MRTFRRRLTPSTLIATIALIAATSGTAIAADVVITSPDQLGDDVVTQRSTADDAIGQAQLKNRAVTQLREAHPHLRARVAVNGAGQTTLLAGDVNTLTGLQRIQQGQVRVTFDTANTLGAGRSLSACAFTATPEVAFRTAAAQASRSCGSTPRSRPVAPSSSTHSRISTSWASSRSTPASHWSPTADLRRGPATPGPRSQGAALREGPPTEGANIDRTCDRRA
jgi:hypothetical protein